MTPDNLKRKLTTILSAGVKGYSRLIGDDEEGTIPHGYLTQFNFPKIAAFISF